MKAFIAALFLGLGAWYSGPSLSQSYPDKPVRLVVPYAAGGSGDVVARSIGAKLTEYWGQQILIDNRPGAAGAIGTASVARAAPDGYTLLVADDAPLAVSPHLNRSLQYDPQKDFAPIVQMARVEFVLTVNPAIPAANLVEFIAFIKREPGKHSYASAGIGSIHHLSMEWLKQLAGIDLVHVPYKGSGQILPDVIAGQVPITYTGIAQTMPHVRAGKLKAIALGGSQRMSAAPGVAIIAETFPGFDGSAGWNLLAPAGTSPIIVRKLNADVNRALKDPKTAEHLLGGGLPAVGGSAEDFAARIRADHARWGKLIASIGLKVE